jgi:Tfp pilus assembly protein PilO
MRLGKKQDNKEEKKKPQLESASAALQLANQYQVWFLVLLVVAIIGIGYLLLLGPKFTELQDKNDNFIPNKQRVLADLNKIEQKLVQLESKFNQVQITRAEQLEQLFSFLPSEPDYASLFVQAEFLAENNNMELQTIDVTRTLERPLAERRDPSPAQAQSPTEQSLEVLPANVRSVQVSLRLGAGSYEDFKQYLEALERNIRLYDVQTLSFDSIDPETGDIGGFTITAKTYYQLRQDNE